MTGVTCLSLLHGLSVTDLVGPVVCPSSLVRVYDGRAPERRLCTSPIRVCFSIVWSALTEGRSLRPVYINADSKCLPLSSPVSILLFYWFQDKVKSSSTPRPWTPVTGDSVISKAILIKFPRGTRQRGMEPLTFNDAIVTSHWLLLLSSIVPKIDDLTVVFSLVFLY